MASISIPVRAFSEKLADGSVETKISINGVVLFVVHIDKDTGQPSTRSVDDKNHIHG